MEKIKAKIKVHGDAGPVSLFEVAVAEHWVHEGAYNPKESYCILYYNETGEGKIVEAEYDGGGWGFKEKADYANARLVNIPESLAKSAREPLDEIPQSLKEELTQEQTDSMISMPWDFKPLSDSDLEFVRENCYKP